MTNIEEQQTRRAFPRYPAYKDSGVEWLGQIPAHWEVKRLKFVVSFHGGGTPSKDNLNYWNGDIPWVSPKDMKAESITDTEDHITGDAVADSATRVIQPGAVLIVVRSGILRHSLPVAINIRPVALNQDMKALIPNRSLEASYLKYLIAGHQSTLLVQWRKEGATVESIEHEPLVNTSCPFPSPLEQKAITDFLDRETAKIDALVAKKERLIQLLQEKRTALISHAVTKGVDLSVPMKNSSIEWPGAIPAHWQVSRLKILTSFVTSGSRGWAEHYSDDGAIFLRIGNLSRTSIDPDLRDIQYVSPPQGAEQERTRVQRDDVLISITAYIRAVAVVADDIGEAYVNQHICRHARVKVSLLRDGLGIVFSRESGSSSFASRSMEERRTG